MTDSDIHTAARAAHRESLTLELSELLVDGGGGDDARPSHPDTLRRLNAVRERLADLTDPPWSSAVR